MSAEQGVLVILDGTDPASRLNRELLSAARQIADAGGGPVAAAILTATPAADAEQAITFGADAVYLACAPWLAPYQGDAAVIALSELWRELAPRVLLLAHTAAGRELAPRLAVRLGAGLVSDCVALRFESDAGVLVGTRPCFSGKALAEWEVDAVSGRPAIATLRRQAVVPADACPERTGPVITRELPPLPAGALRTRVVEQVVPPPTQLRLEDASVVVAAGRGVGDSAALQEHIIDGLARTLGAAWGGSRGAVDNGIVPAELQIGLTGRQVSPELYIAVGISGAPQHMAGCSGARCIVAVNTDPDAPIFGFAHYGVVGDYRRVVPALTAAFQQQLAVAVGD